MMIADPSYNYRRTNIHQGGLHLSGPFRPLLSPYPRAVEGGLAALANVGGAPAGWRDRCGESMQAMRVLLAPVQACAPTFRLSRFAAMIASCFGVLR